MKNTKSPLVIIRRIPSMRYVGVSDAAKTLGVSKQAIYNYVSGTSPTSINPDKASRIKVISK